MTEKGQSWLLHPQLRGVLEQHIVPESRCLLLRYTLSRVCRDLWLRAFIVRILYESNEVSLAKGSDFERSGCNWILPEVIRRKL